MALAKRNTVNYLTDLATFVALLCVALTGLLLKFVLPPGSSRGGLSLLGLGRHDWGEIHFWATVALGAVLLLHIAMHWSWVCGTTKRLLTGKSATTTGRARASWGVAALLMIALFFGGFILIARANVTKDSEPERGQRIQESGGSHERQHRGRQAR